VPTITVEGDRALDARFQVGSVALVPGARRRCSKNTRSVAITMSPKLSPAAPEDVVKAIAFGLRFESGRRVWQADEYTTVTTAKRLIEHLTLDSFVVLKLPPLGGHSALGRGFEGCGFEG
jgi:hypothetical protein